MSKQNKQPLLQRPAVVGVLASLLSIVVGLVLGFVLLVLLNPGAAVGGMKAMLATGFSSMDKLGKVLYQAAPLMMCGLSVGFAFKTGLFNIGASGQYTMGAFFSLLCAIQFQMPWYVCLLAGAVGGAIWGVFPGLFKAYFNVNEVITAIMFNWIGMYLVNLLLANMPNMLASGWGASNSDRTAALNVANPGAILPRGPFAALFGNSSWINISIIITIIFAILVWVILQKTTFGYELKACGLSRDAAQYAGINSKRNIVLSMVISGALSGIGGGTTTWPVRANTCWKNPSSAWASTASLSPCWPAPTPSARFLRRSLSAISRSAVPPCSPPTRPRPLTSSLPSSSIWRPLPC